MKNELTNQMVDELCFSLFILEVYRKNPESVIHDEKLLVRLEELKEKASAIMQMLDETRLNQVLEHLQEQMTTLKNNNPLATHSDNSHNPEIT